MRNRQTRLVPKRAPCPCGSGLKLKDCCASKDFRWEQDDRGEFSKVVPLTKEVAEALKDTADEFRAVFRRDPGPDDRLFIQAYVISDEDLAEMAEKALSVVTDKPALAYAARKTGRIVTSFNERFIPDVDLEEWDNAVEEYETHGGEPIPDEHQAFYAAVARLDQEAKRLPYILGMVVMDCGVRGPMPLLSKKRFARDFAFFAAARSLKSFRAITHLLEKNLAEDALSLVRTVYENYLHALFAVKHPESAFSIAYAKAGVRAGTHGYATTRAGRIDYRTIVDRVTGERVRADITTREMASSSPFKADLQIHAELYSLLSRFVHPHLLTLPHYLGPDGFHATGRDMLIEAFVFEMAVASMLMDVLLQVQFLKRQARKDLRIFVHYLRNAILDVFDAAEAVHGSAFNPILRDRVALTGMRWPHPSPVGKPSILSSTDSPARRIGN